MVLISLTSAHSGRPWPVGPTGGVGRGLGAQAPARGAPLAAQRGQPDELPVAPLAQTGRELEQEQESTPAIR